MSDSLPAVSPTRPELQPPGQEHTGLLDQNAISADEIALYDRQIRLWGMTAQEQIRNSHILLVGLKALGNEIAKNLVLAGIGALTVLDHELVAEHDLAAQFFVSEEHIGQNRAQAALPQIQKLNPRVLVFAEPDPVISKAPEYYSSFDITIVTSLPLDMMSSINTSCRFFNRKFYAADTHGMYGFVLADLIVHNFVVEKDRPNRPTKVGDLETTTRTVVAVSTKRENGKVTETVTKQEVYSPIILANSSPLPASISRNRRSRMQVTPLLSCLRAVFDFQKISGGRLPSHSRADLEIFTRLTNEKHLELQLPVETLRSEFLRSFLQNLGSEVSAVAAFLGGALAQDVINVLGQREQPIQNMLLFDGEELKSTIYGMHPISFEDSLTQPTSNGFRNGQANEQAISV